MRTFIDRTPSSLLAAFLFAILLAFSALAAKAQDGHFLMITGHLICPPGLDKEASAYMEAGDGERMAIRLKRNGRFRLIVPISDRYLLHFQMPGCVSKEVVIDATHVADVRRAGEHRTTFDVVLHADDPERSARYLRPVGSIVLRSMAGAPRITYDYQLAPVSSFTAWSEED
ncbi:MAG: hypothetical protein H6595_02875 [Flavobacteriales bacterium]|nr:hypothetical protein [Flavobacteriales bacterium]MCB9166402.1 hypothetical protein [Flavobacteriales bacterium]